MINNQHIEFLHDTERDRAFIFLARDAKAFDLYQIPLIDAYIGVVDYQPNCSYVITPTAPKNTGIIFKDTFFVKPHDIVDPQAMIIDDMIVNAAFSTVEQFISVPDILSHFTDYEMLIKSNAKLIGITKHDNNSFSQQDV